MDLKNFSHKAISEITDEVKKTVIKNAEKIEEEFKQKEPESYKSINEVIDKYSGLGEQDLTSELLRVAKEGKESGTIDENQIKSTYNMLYPMLNDEQKAKLDNLIKLIT